MNACEPPPRFAVGRFGRIGSRLYWTFNKRIGCRILRHGLLEVFANKASLTQTTNEFARRHFRAENSRRTRRAGRARARQRHPSANARRRGPSFLPARRPDNPDQRNRRRLLIRITEFDNNGSVQERSL